MRYLRIPEDFPSGDPDFRMMMERYPKCTAHYARLIPVDDNFASEVMGSYWAHVMFCFGPIDKPQEVDV